jgi:hypothetical protein
MVGYAVAQLVQALYYKPESRGFDSRELCLFYMEFDSCHHF